MSRRNPRRGFRRYGPGEGSGVEPRLVRHLRQWLGRWPAPAPGMYVVGSAGREQPGWNGQVHPVVGVCAVESGVLSVPPGYRDAVRALTEGSPERLLASLPSAVGRPDAFVYQGVFRWSVEPAPLPDAGVWVSADDPVVPDWLRVFGGEVLVTLDPDSGAYLAGVGIKWHDRYGQELSVGTAPEARGRGLARRLAAQAARRVVEGGGVATY